MILMRTRAAMAVALAIALVGCAATKDSGDAGRAGGDAASDRAHAMYPVGDAPRLDPSAKAALAVGEVDSADPSLPLSNLEQFDAVVLGTVDAFSAGPEQPVAENDPDGLRRALPSGTLALVAVSTVDETVDKYLSDPFAGVPEDATRYIAGAPYAAFADGPAKTWFPLLGLTSDAPLTALVPPRLQGKLP